MPTRTPPLPTAAAAPATQPEPQQWLARFGDELYRYTLGRVAEASAAEELVQETLVGALGALASFRGQASERTWLFVILKRKIIDHCRRQARSPFVPLGLAPEHTPEAEFFRPADGHWRADQSPQPWAVSSEDGWGDAALEQAELQAVLQGCQQRLSAQQLVVFRLRFVEELPAEDICHELNLTAANYWVFIHRAKLYLRRCLEKTGLRSPSPHEHSIGPLQLPAGHAAHRAPRRRSPAAPHLHAALGAPAPVPLLPPLLVSEPVPCAAGAGRYHGHRASSPAPAHCRPRAYSAGA